MLNTVALSRSLRLWSLAITCAGIFLPHHASLAFDGAKTDIAPGAWEISDADGSRKCRITLRPETAGGLEHRLAMPAGCKRAFPILVEAGGWMASENNGLALADRMGQPVLAFAPAEDDRLIAKGPRGEIYELEPVERPRQTVAQVQPTPSSSTGFTTSPSASRPAASPGIRRVPSAAAPAPVAPVAATTAPQEQLTTSPVIAYPGRANDLAGRYNILREADKDMGCLLTLDGTAHGPGGNKAQLAPACRDQGIVVFDPVGWRFDRGNLILRARKGHDARFLYHADGVWRKDPKEGGKTLGLKKI